MGRRKQRNPKTIHPRYQDNLVVRVLADAFTIYQRDPTSVQTNCRLFELGIRNAKCEMPAGLGSECSIEWVAVVSLGIEYARSTGCATVEEGIIYSKTLSTR